jgi:1-acyl-sn-glycerol-3-phosphate acyltransferase
MLRTLYYIIYIFFSFLCTIPKLMGVQKTQEPTTREALAHDIVNNWARKVVLNTGSKITIIGQEKIPEHISLVFVGNHQSFFDVPILLGWLNKPLSFIAKKELLKMPLLRSWMQEIKCIFLDRQNPREGLKAITDGVSLLKKGNCVAIFPEGTRSKDGQLGEFKAGALRLATKSNAPIIPITIIDTYKIFEGNKFGITATPIKIIVDEPIYTEGLSKEEQNELPEKIRNIIIKNMQNY